MKIDFTEDFLKWSKEYAAGKENPEAHEQHFINSANWLLPHFVQAIREIAIINSEIQRGLTNRIDYLERLQFRAATKFAMILEDIAKHELPGEAKEKLAKYISDLKEVLKS